MKAAELLGQQDLAATLVKLDLYLASGAPIDGQVDRLGWSLLHVACEHQDELLIRALAMRGADLDNRCRCGHGPIFLALDVDIDGAIQTGAALTFSTTMLLVALGAAPAATDAEGGSLRDWAGRYGEKVLTEFDKRLAEAIQGE